MKAFFNKTYKYAPIIFFAFMLLYNNPNVISLISGLIVLIYGELLRFQAFKKQTSFLNGNSFIYLGLATMSNAVFPYLLILMVLYYFFLYIFSREIYEQKKDQEIKESKKLVEFLKLDIGAVRAWSLTAIVFILIWGIRRI